MAEIPQAPAAESSSHHDARRARIVFVVGVTAVMLASALPWFMRPTSATSTAVFAGMAYGPAKPESVGIISSRKSNPGAVSFVDPAGPAFAAGIRVLDQIERVQGIPITDGPALEHLAHSMHPNDTVVYRLVRDSVVWNPLPGTPGVPMDSKEADFRRGLAVGQALSGTGSKDAPSAGRKQGRALLQHVRRDVAVRLEATVGWAQNVVSAIALLAALIYLATAGIAFFKRPGEHKVVLLAALLVSGAAGWIAETGMQGWLRLTEAGLQPAAGALTAITAASTGVSFLLGMLFLVLLTQFVLVFPRPRPVLAKRPRILLWIYAIIPGIALPMAANWSLVFGDMAHETHSALLGLAARVLAAVGVLGMIVLAMEWRARHPNAGRLLSRPVLVGLALALLGAAPPVLLALNPRGGETATSEIGIAIGLLVAMLYGLCEGVLAVVLIVAIVVCLMRNYREGGVEERRQIRWPLWGVGVGLLVPLGLFAVRVPVMLSGLGNRLPATALEVASDLCAIAIPISFATAVLKYRLMEIDLVIRKTIVYASLTGVLFLLYAVLVGGVGGVVDRLAPAHGQQARAVATAAVALAVFPLRTRVQKIMDKRFFRTRFVAADALKRVSAAVSGAGSTGELLRAGVEEAQQALQSRMAAAFLYQPDSRVLAAAETLGVPDERRRVLRLTLDDAALGALLAEPTRDVSALSGGLAALVRLAEAALVVPITHHGSLKGVLALGSRMSDEGFGEEDRGFLAALASQLGAGLAGAEAGSRTRELNEARVIQAGLLPAELPQAPGMELAAQWQPAREVAGDLYDAFRIGDAIGFCIADVTGKGMPAALLVSSIQATLRGASALGLPPAGLIERVNRTMSSQMAAGRFVTLFYGAFDPARRELRYVNAGHNCPMLLRADGPLELLDKGGLLVGIFPEAKYEEGRVEMGAGDRLLLYTDGITEAQAPDGELYGEERLEVLLRASSALDATALQARILAAAGEFCAGEWQDDATLMVLAVS